MTFYRANRDLSFVKAGDTFTEKDVPPGVVLEVLTLGRLVTEVLTLVEEETE